MWRKTKKKLVTKNEDGLQAHVKKWWAELRMEIDRDAIPALAADRERLWAQLSAASFLSDEEKRQMLGLDHGRCCQRDAGRADRAGRSAGNRHGDAARPDRRCTEPWRQTRPGKSVDDLRLRPGSDKSRSWTE